MGNRPDTSRMKRTIFIYIFARLIFIYPHLLCEDDSAGYAKEQLHVVCVEVKVFSDHGSCVAHFNFESVDLLATVAKSFQRRINGVHFRPVGMMMMMMSGFGKNTTVSSHPNLFAISSSTCRHRETSSRRDKSRHGFGSFSDMDKRTE